MYLAKLIGFGITSYSHLFFRKETVDISHKRSFDVLDYGGKQGPKKGLTDAAIMLCKLNKSL